jgi:hypothetical protein
MSPPVKAVARRRRRSKTRGGGAARNSFEQAFEKIGGVDALAEWGRKTPTEFFRLFTRLVLLTGEAAVDSLEIEIVRFSDPEEADGEDPAA